MACGQKGERGYMIKFRWWQSLAAYTALIAMTLIFILPILIVLMNSFKGQFYIADAPFVPPNAQTFVGFQNYINGIAKTGFFSAFGYSLFITVFSVLLILITSSMAAWYLMRVRNKFTKTVYYLLVLQSHIHLRTVPNPFVYDPALI